MKQLYKIAFVSLVAGFITAAFGAEVTSQNVSERKTCDEISLEIADLSTISEPDEETTKKLTQLKKMQRAQCLKSTGSRGKNSATKTRAINTTEQTPDENGCMPGEIYTDMGEMGFNCCPESGGDCFPPIVPENSTDSESVVSESPEIQPELTDEQRAQNIANGLCADGTKPNKFGCCGDEIFTDLGNTVFACCPKSGGDCFPPIK